jgi:putative flippase GtrA
VPPPTLSSPSPVVSPLLRVYYGLHTIVRELMKFGIVGGVAFVVDVGVFNLARVGADMGPLTSKTISVVLATTVAYFGNRYWTFRHRDRKGLRLEYVLFFAFNAIGLAIALACLGFSHYVLGFNSALADNISANGIGLALGTAFRFWSYRRWVFPELAEATHHRHPSAPGTAAPEPEPEREPEREPELRGPRPAP